LHDDAAREPSGISSSKISRAPQRGAGWALGASAIAFVSLAFVFAPRVNLPLAHAPDRAEVTPGALASAAQPLAAVPSATPAALAPSERQSWKSAPQKAEEVARVHPAVPVASAEPEQFGALKITADPRATVEVSGAHFHQLGQSPLVGLRVPVGRYQIVFRNDTFGAPLSAQVMVVAGASRSVHADFRQAEPAVSVR
jgi:hypothetical protein